MRWENGARKQNSCSRAGRTGPARYHLRFLEIRAPLLESVTQERTRRAGGGGQEKSMSQQHMLPLSAPPPPPFASSRFSFYFGTGHLTPSTSLFWTSQLGPEPPSAPGLPAISASALLEGVQYVSVCCTTGPKAHRHHAQNFPPRPRLLCHIEGRTHALAGRSGPRSSIGCHDSGLAGSALRDIGNPWSFLGVHENFPPPKVLGFNVLRVSSAPELNAHFRCDCAMESVRQRASSPTSYRTTQHNREAEVRLTDDDLHRQ